MICLYSTVDSLDLNSMEYEQTVEVINLFVSLYQSVTLSTNLLRDSLELTQVEISLNSPVLEADYKKFAHLVTCS